MVPLIRPSGAPSPTRGEGGMDALAGKPRRTVFDAPRPEGAPMARKKTPTSVSVDAHKHVADRRANIPTRETAAFADDDGIGKAIYHRDRSLDPQLVWKGKDEQDSQPFEVPAVPLHVQEKI